MFSSYLLLLHLFIITSIPSNGGNPRGIPSTFKITAMTTYNMNTTVYWNPPKSSQNQSITYYIEYNDGLHGWNSSRCSSLRRHKDSGLLSCLFLTCDSTQLDAYYEVRVRAGDLSNNGSVTDSSLHNPSDQNIPDEITDVRLTANSLTEVSIKWTLPPHFCMRVGYCMNIHYRKTGAGTDTVGKKLLSNEMKKNLQCNITGLQPCTEYSFNVTVFNGELCDISPADFGLRTTGPFRITTPSGVNFTQIPIRVENFNTAIYWRPHAVCPIVLLKYNILFKANNEEWRESNCTIRENKTRNELSCLFLTCETTKDSSYVVNVVNSFGPKNYFRFFRPSLENIPPQISNVSISAVSSKALRISWKTPFGFCLKFPPCIRIYYENKSVVVEGNKEDQQLVVHNLFSYTNYSFYVITYQKSLDCSDKPVRSLGATGPFTGWTLEDAPSQPPVLICGLCDITTDGVERNGTVRWKLPRKEKWNGVPRVFMIQWHIKNQSEPVVWRNVTIKQKLAKYGTLTGLSLYVGYVVRVRMCNGELCSAFSKEMTIDAEKSKVITKQPNVSDKSSSDKNLALLLGLTAAALTIFFIVLVSVCLKKSRWCPNRLYSNRNSTELPELGGVRHDYENVENVSVNEEYYSVTSVEQMKPSIVEDEDTRSDIILTSFSNN